MEVVPKIHMCELRSTTSPNGSLWDSSLSPTRSFSSKSTSPPLSPVSTARPSNLRSLIPSPPAKIKRKPKNLGPPFFTKSVERGSIYHLSRLCFHLRRVTMKNVCGALSNVVIVRVRWCFGFSIIHLLPFQAKILYQTNSPPAYMRSCDFCLGKDTGATTN